MKPNTAATWMQTLLGSPAAAFPHEQGALQREGKYLYDNRGEPWFGRGLTMFLLYARWLQGEDNRPELAYAREVGANYLRLFGPVPVPPWGEEWRFYSRPDPGLFADLPRFLELVGDAGLRCEFVPVCGPWSQAEALDLLVEVYELCAVDIWNLFVEWTNEPGQSGTYHAGNLHAFDTIPRHGILSATGLAWLPDDATAQVLIGIPHCQHFWQAHWLDYGTPHLNDTQHDRYGRISKYLKEWRDGDHDNYGNAMEGSYCPEWNDEGARVDDTDTYPDVETHVANTAIACLFGGTSLIHYNLGKVGMMPVPGGLEDTVIREASRVWAFIPPVAQTGSYTRGDFQDFLVYWTPADSTIEHAYGVWVGNVGWAVNPLPTMGWEAIPKPGITIEAGPRPWILKATR